MLKDSDLFPITCPRCHEQTYKEIVGLKTEARIRCSGCGVNLWFNPTEFARVIDEAKKPLADIARSIRAADE